MGPAGQQTHETDLSWRHWDKDSRSRVGTVVPGDTCDTICEITAQASLSEDAVDNRTSSCDLDNRPNVTQTVPTVGGAS